MDLMNLGIPYITEGIEGIGGEIKETPEDFVVEEIPVYQPDGEGEHLFVHLTKKGITTRDVQKALAGIYQVSSRAVNFAGIKDKHAVASQYFSVWLKDKEKKDKKFKQVKDQIDTIRWHLGNRVSNLKYVPELRLRRDDTLDRVEKIEELLEEEGEEVEEEEISGEE